MTAPLYPVFLELAGRAVVVVGGGPVAAGKLAGLREVGARVTVIAPAITDAIRALVDVQLVERAFAPADLDGAHYVVAAATPEVNREVAAAARARRLFVNAVDDVANASAYLGGVVRRGDVTVAISTRGVAPALAGMLREAIDAVLPAELERWVAVAMAARADWKRAKVPMAERRPLLFRALERLYTRPAARPAGGHVALVGAGPGAKDLLTQRAIDRLADADLVLVDALVADDVLALAPRARRFYVGKRRGRHSIEQEAIHRLMIRAANRGERVVRLKCGDPFVLGRGGEEALALEAAGIAYEIVPGLSSAIAAPALAGIPVTHRGLATGFVVASGHARAAYAPIVDSLAPGSATLVLLMAVATRADIAAHLVARGWDPATPAAVVFGASHADPARWVGSLAELGTAAMPATAQPGVVVVGAVVALAHRIANEHPVSVEQTGAQLS